MTSNRELLQKSTTSLGQSTIIITAILSIVETSLDGLDEIKIHTFEIAFQRQTVTYFTTGSDSQTKQIITVFMILNNTYTDQRTIFYLCFLSTVLSNPSCLK